MLLELAFVTGFGNWVFLDKPSEQVEDITECVQYISKKFSRPEDEVKSIVLHARNHPDLPILGIIRVESSFNPNARNPKSTAKGLMQLTKSSGMQPSKPHSIWESIQNGARLLKKYRKRVNGLYLHAYYRGVTAVKKGARAPEYVQKVMTAQTKLEKNGC